MHLAAAMLAPFLLLVGGARASEHVEDEAVPDAADAARAFSKPLPSREGTQWPAGALRSFQPDSAWQVRIEQRMTIRIVPRATMPIAPDILSAMPQQGENPRFLERKVGKCLPVSAIAGVQPHGGSSLILHMRDRRMISAELDRTCRARDFYSGFYLAGSSDGMLCVDRDLLQSRSGAHCTLSRLRQLIARDE